MLVWGCSDDSGSSATGKSSGSQDSGSQGGGSQGGGSQGGGSQSGGSQGGGSQGGGSQGGGSQTDPTCEGIDFQTSNENCGECGHSCKKGTCQDGECVCDTGYLDCDQDGSCETYGECPCDLGETETCYTGPAETADVGECKSGTRTCLADPDGGVSWSNCEGMVVPSYTSYICEAGSTLDKDCNHIADSRQDEDGDGFYLCAPESQPTDCCDNSRMCATSRPDFVNPRKTVDCDGNRIDDDCDGEIDEDKDQPCGNTGGENTCSFKKESCSEPGVYTLPPIDSNTKATNQDGELLVKAMDNCLEKVTSASGKAGILEVTLTQNSSGTVYRRQINIKDGMYSKAGEKLISPRSGKTFAMLSSGGADDAAGSIVMNDEEFNKFNMVSPQSLPRVYRRIHGSGLNTHSLCEADSSINDSLKLHIKMRAPEEAQGFSFDFRFFTREYPFYICSPFNDFFLAILTDENGNAIADTNGNERLNDEDGNISFDMLNNPISVNSAFFTTCEAPGCNQFYSTAQRTCPANLTCGSDNKCGTCPDGNDELYAYYPDPYNGGRTYQQTQKGLESTSNRGGGTAWLTTKAPVTPGQVFNLDFYIWDTGDALFDSTVLIDNFQWLCDETSVSTGFAPPIDNVN